MQVVLEHITTRDAADFVAAGPDTLAATVTPQHMLMNRNALFLVPIIPSAQILTATMSLHASRANTATFAQLNSAYDPADLAM